MLLLLLFLLQGVVFHTLSICLFLLRDQMVDSYKTFALVLVSVYFRYVQRSFQLFLRSEKFLKPLILLPVFLLFVCVCVFSIGLDFGRKNLFVNIACFFSRMNVCVCMCVFLCVCV